MLAASRRFTRITRCSTCSVAVLNTLVSACGASVRLPVPPVRALTSASGAAAVRLRHHAGLLAAARGFHHAAAARAAPLDEIIEDVFESVTETATELFETETEGGTGGGTEGGKTPAKEVGEVIGTVTDSVVNVITTEHRRTVRKEQTPEDGAAAAEAEEAAEEDGTAQAQAVPWFLRVETPRPASHPLAARQALPALPPAPPAALQPLLTQLADELGVGDLAIMDLRTMDPPPAIGPDTIMVLGTARSERHLHTSADKLCRWLRSAWALRPDADGLLGRSELRIKNRRLRRRGKLISTQTGQEEGVGWICVNAGGQGLVVQLFTQHRRDEIDLEGLWGKYLGADAITRSPRAAEAEEQRQREAEEAEEEGLDGRAEVRYSPRAPLIRLGAGLSTGSEYTPGPARPPHSRAFSTCAPRRTQLPTPAPAPTPAPMPADPAKPQPGNLIDGIAFRGIEVALSVAKGKPWQLIKQLPASYTPATHPAVAGLILRAHINLLRKQYPGWTGSGSRAGPCTLLGAGPADTDSTDFLRTFHAHLPPTPSPATHQLRLELLIEAHRIAPAAYPASCLTDFLAALAAQTAPAPAQELYYLAMHALSHSPTALRPNAAPSNTPADLTTFNTLTNQLLAAHPSADASAPEYALCRLRALAPPSLPLAHALALTVCTPTARTPTHAVEKRADKLPRMGRYRLDSRVHTLDEVVRSRAGRHYAYTLREWHEMLLTAYAMCGAWRAFWNAWARIRLLGVRRDEGLYRLVVGLVVMGGSQREGVQAGRELVTGMGREVPPVGVGLGMARGLLALVDLAEGVSAGREAEGEEGEGEGGVAEQVKAERGQKGEWRVLREKCEKVIRRLTPQPQTADS